MLSRVLSVLIVVFIAAAVYLSFTVTLRQGVLRQTAHYNDTFAFSQTVVEVLRLESTLARYEVPDIAVPMSDVELRLDIAISRLVTFTGGSLKRFVNATPERRALIDDLSTEIDYLDANLDNLTPQMVADVLDRLDTLVGPLINAAAQKVHEGRAEVEKNIERLEMLHKSLNIVIVFLVLCWLLLFMLLLRQNKLLTQSQRESAALHRSLNAVGEELRSKNRKLEHAAHYDSLTNLPNRALFWSELEKAIRVVGGGEQDVVLLLLDLDRFKNVNDTLGHDLGDLLLLNVGHRLRALENGPDIFFRLGGDEFACLMLNRSVDESLAVARAIVAALSVPYELDGRRVQIGCSIGVVSARAAQCSDARMLFKYADVSLYQAKASQSNRVCMFEKKLQERLDSEKELQNDLRRAINEDAFEVVYQPQEDVVTGELRGLEAFTRWTHPDHGPISPKVFIPIAEELGLAPKFEKLILLRACREATRWQKPLKICVNVSFMQLQSADIVSTIQNILIATGLKPERLELDIAETVFLGGNKSVLCALGRLRALGVSIALDHFGTGVSSFAILRGLPVDTLKLDKTFVRDLTTNSETESLLRLIGELGALLGKDVIIEGVETTAQRDTIHAMKFGVMQGARIGVPVAPSRLDHLRAPLGKTPS